ncbi:hypothetical protein JJB07_07360 [Tumebacillus sp. ITR2]|uniref:Uncharacterized protein n=1 Tax=Tumebacillus amylolyticus TaxID=2801339 RepID=A0ABS1J846_9BACL|nr:hypothetical protein [Tumebacillus amylolyticus]MBL0386462.1 hypothetical protein [Tumebacillus amylolyticus]
MRVFEKLDEMQRHVTSGDLQALERLMNLDERTREVSLSLYQEQLEKGLKKALQLAKRTFSQAVYFEYDLDNGWDSSFFVCKNYNPPEAEDEDWACPGPGTRDFAGPSLPEFAELYTEFETPTTVSLIAATVLAYIRACRNVQSDDIHLCIAFHDQDPILRV